MVLSSGGFQVVAVVVLPHYEAMRSPPPSPQGPPLLGIDARTAALWDGTRWSALGAGRVLPFRIASMADMPPPVA